MGSIENNTKMIFTNVNTPVNNITNKQTEDNKTDETSNETKNYTSMATQEDNLSFLEYEAIVMYALKNVKQTNQAQTNPNGIIDSIKAFEIAFNELKSLGLSDNDTFAILDRMSDIGV